jgi:ACR3 family arsenite efflux pump ArsB
MGANKKINPEKLSTIIDQIHTGIIMILPINSQILPRFFVSTFLVISSLPHFGHHVSAVSFSSSNGFRSSIALA